MATKRLKLRNSNRTVLVDEDDFAYLNLFIWKIQLKNGEYKDVCSTHYGKIVRVSRIVMNVDNPDIFVDHINGNTLDNRKSNLRLATAKQNSRNIGKRKGKFTSKYKGVNYNKKAKKYSARINTDNGRLFLGYFETEQEAAEIYNKAALEHHKQFARLNKV